MPRGVLVVVLCMLSHLWAQPAQAGSGTVRYDPLADVYLLDFCVSIKFDATPTQLLQIRTTLQNGSDVLYDATDGQYAFGRVDLINNDLRGGWDSEVWIHPGEGRANATLGGFGTGPGLHINLHYLDNFQNERGPDNDAFTTAHEFVHHVWGVADEYQSRNPPPGPGFDAECEPLPRQFFNRYSLMDNYLQAGANINCPDSCVNPCTDSRCDNFTNNELCVFTGPDGVRDHDPDGDSAQSFWNKINPNNIPITSAVYEDLPPESCWDTLSTNVLYPVTPPPPGQLPEDTPPPNPPVVMYQEFQNGEIERAFVFCIDRSGSMSTMDFGAFSATRLNFAQNATFGLLQSLSLGSWAGIVTFNDMVDVVRELTPLDSELVRSDLADDIYDVIPEGQTAIGDAILESAAQIAARDPDENCSRAIFLVTDGQNNRGIDLADPTLLTALREFKIALFVVGVGYDPVILDNGDAIDLDLAPLAFMARATGGDFIAVEDPNEVYDAANLMFESYIGTAVYVDSGSVPDGGVNGAPVFYGPTSSEARITVSWANPFDQIGLVLRLPDGRVITRADAGAAGIRMIETPNSVRFVISSPVFVPGNWLVEVTGDDLNAAEAGYQLQAWSDSSDANLGLNVETPTALVGEPVLMHLMPTFEGFGVPFTGVQIDARVTGRGLAGDRGPGGAQPVGTVPLTFLDRGSNGDRQANDGVYTAEFVPPAEGVYEIEADIVVGNNVRVLPGEPLFADDAPVSRLTTPFMRTARQQLVVGVDAICYVDERGPRGDGTSWREAATDLQVALDRARVAPGFVREIRVAQGRYTPSRNTLDRTMSFELVNGVAIRGGYPGHDAPDPNDRSGVTGETILSGDLQNDDEPGFVNRGDNSIHVVNASGLGPETVIEGFVIEGGNADISRGGGVFADGTCRALFDGCVFRDNRSVNGGGGFGGANGSAPWFLDCDFIGNMTSTGGGGAELLGVGRPLFERCRFIGNRSGVSGAAGISVNESAPDVFGCLFVGNASFGFGGAMTLLDTVGDPARVHGSTFYLNSAGSSSPWTGGAIFANSGGEVRVVNSIAWQNRSGSGTTVEQQIDGVVLPETSFSIVQGFVLGALPGFGTIGDDPMFVDAMGADGIEGTEDDNVRLLAGSPAIDSGALADSSLLDLDGNERVLDGDGDGSAVIDRGAYEFVESPVCLADVNMNGEVEPTDFGAWLSAYNGGDPAADQNQDGEITPTDFGAWLSNYNAGCD